MKENKYDDPRFFEKYSRMARSQKGLSRAGEWHELEKLLPDFRGRRVLDLGCGYGWHCRYAAEHGAAYVLGTDISQKMLETARERNPGPSIEYRQAAMEDLRFPDGSFVFSVEHPVFTAYGSQDWFYGPDGEILHFPVDNYS